MNTLLSIALLLTVSPVSSAGAPHASSLPSPQASTRRVRPLVVVHDGSLGGRGDLVLYDERTGVERGRPASWRDVTILPIDFVGRVAIEALDPTRPRLGGEGSPTPRVLLQDGLGALYRYQRRAEGGAEYFGWMYLPAEGAPRGLFELPGTGVVGQDDPFVPRLGVEDGGRSLLVATRPAAGGDLYEVDLASGVATERTALLPPLSFSDAGLWLLDGWGFGVATSGVYRFQRSPGAQARRVPALAKTAGMTWTGQAVVSDTGNCAMTTAETGSGLQVPYHFGPEGTAERIAALPALLSGAGFLPESGGGPYMAISDDGQLAGWRLEGVKRELMVSRITSHVLPTQVSADQWFLDTLDEIGMLGMYRPGVLTAAIGEAPGAGQELSIEKIDLFEIELSTTGAPTFRNLSLSSGDGAEPFTTPGEIDPDLLVWVPEAQSFLISDGGLERFGSVRTGVSGFNVLLPAVKEGYWVERSGDQLVAALRRSMDPKPREVYHMPADLSSGATLLVPGTSGSEFLARTLDVDGSLAYRVELVPGQEWLMRVRAATAQVDSFAATPARYSRTLGRTADGAVLLRQGLEGLPGQLWIWPEAGPRLALGTPSLTGTILPAR